MKCPLCNNEIGIFRNRLSLDGVLCKECSDKIIEETYSKYGNKRCKSCFHKTKYIEELNIHKCQNCGKEYSVEEAKEMAEYDFIDDSFDFVIKWAFILFFGFYAGIALLMGLFKLGELGLVGVIFFFLIIFAIFYSPPLDKE